MKNVQKAQALAEKMTFKRGLRLNVAGAYQSRLMESASVGFEKMLQHIEFHPPRIKVLTNVTRIIAPVHCTVMFEGAITLAGRAETLILPNIVAAVGVVTIKTMFTVTTFGRQFFIVIFCNAVAFGGSAVQPGLRTNCFDFTLIGDLSFCFLSRLVSFESSAGSAGCTTLATSFGG
jgi:hypothetical protein